MNCQRPENGLQPSLTLTSSVVKKGKEKLATGFSLIKAMVCKYVDWKVVVGEWPLGIIDGLPGAPLGTSVLSQIAKIAKDSKMQKIQKNSLFV